MIDFHYPIRNNFLAINRKATKKQFYEKIDSLDLSNHSRIRKSVRRAVQLLKFWDLKQEQIQGNKSLTNQIILLMVDIELNEDKNAYKLEKEVQDLIDGNYRNLMLVFDSANKPKPIVDKKNKVLNYEEELKKNLKEYGKEKNE